jgi:hypothetical protein
MMLFMSLPPFFRMHSMDAPLSGILRLFLFQGASTEQTWKKLGMLVYPVPQNAPYVSAGMNVPKFPEGQCPKATDVSPWHGPYLA